MHDLYKRQITCLSKSSVPHIQSAFKFAVASIDALMLSNIFINDLWLLNAFLSSDRNIVKFKINESNLRGIFVSRGQHVVRGQCLDFEIFFEIVLGKRSNWAR